MKNLNASKTGGRFFTKKVDFDTGLLIFTAFLILGYYFFYKNMPVLGASISVLSAIVFLLLHKVANAFFIDVNDEGL